MKKIKSDNKGFSLIELIIVIAIMAVLVAIIAPNLTKYLGSSKEKTDNKNKDEVKSVIQTAITDYETENDGLLITATNDTIKLKHNSATAPFTDNAGSVTAPDAFIVAVNKAMNNDGDKLQSKKNKSKYLNATITRQSDGTYKIDVEFDS